MDEFSLTAESWALPKFDKWQVDGGDATAWLATFPPESVDLIVTDSAYESLDKHRARGTTTRLKQSKSSSNEWFPIFPNARFGDFFRECYRVLARNAHLYFFCDQETMFVAKPIGEAMGFKFWKPIVWDKETIGMGYHYRSQYEFVLFFEKGKRRLANLGQADVIRCKRVHGGYPTEKPVAVAEILVQQSSSAGELVVDPFCGSGAFGEAALRNARRFYGCDVKRSAVELSRQRLGALG